VLIFLLLQVAFAWSHHVLLTGAILFVIGVAQAGFAVWYSPKSVDKYDVKTEM
jgi:hypothetical protein